MLQEIFGKISFELPNIFVKCCRLSTFSKISLNLSKKNSISSYESYDFLPGYKVCFFHWHSKNYFQVECWTLNYLHNTHISQVLDCKSKNSLTLIFNF